MSDGMGCKCAARCEADCCCGADWTSAELAALRTKLELLTTSGICEVAAHNPRVMEWIAEHKRRTKEAKRKLANARREALEEAAKVCEQLADVSKPEYAGLGCLLAMDAIRAKIGEQK